MIVSLLVMLLTALPMPSVKASGLKDAITSAKAESKNEIPSSLFCARVFLMLNSTIDTESAVQDGMLTNSSDLGEIREVCSRSLRCTARLMSYQELEDNLPAVVVLTESDGRKGNFFVVLAVEGNVVTLLNGTYKKVVMIDELEFRSGWAGGAIVSRKGNPRPLMIFGFFMGLLVMIFIIRLWGR